MKKLLFIVCILIVSINSIGQDGVFSRVIAKQSFFLRNTWIDSLRRDTIGWQNDFGSLPTSASVYKFVAGRMGGSSGSGVDSLYVDSTFLKVSSYTADQKRGDVLGSLFDQTGFANFNSFTNPVTFTATISNSKMVQDASLSINTNSQVKLKDTTMLERWTIVTGFKIGIKNGVSYGFGIGVKSTNTTFQQSIQGFMTHRSTTGFDGYLLLSDFSSTLATSSTNISFSAGDSIELILNRNVNIFTLIGRNVTTGGDEISVSYTYQGYTTAANTGTPFWYVGGGVDSVYHYKFYSDESKGAKLLNVGDSKMTWYGNNVTQRIPNLEYQSYGTIISHSGSGDKTGDVVSTLDEIISLEPEQVQVTVGSNDIRTGISSGIWQANIDTIYNKLTRNNITVYFGLMYETAISQAALITYLTSNYSSAYISNGYTATLNCGNCLLADGIHLNAYGNQKWATANFQAGTIDLASGGGGSQTFSNTSDATTHTLTLSSSGGSFQLTEGSGITLTTTGTSLNGIVTIASSGSSQTWNSIISPTGDQSLTFQAGESSTWTDQNTTEDLLSVNNATSVSNSLISLNRTSTALVGTNNVMEILSSGANATGGTTATGLNISVTNTGTGSINNALSLTASGGASFNYALLVPAGRVGIAQPAPQTILHVGPGGTATAFGTAAQLTVSNGGSASYLNVLGASGTETFIGAEATQGIFGTISNTNLVFRANNTTYVTLSTAGVVTMANLAGTGSRNVVADASGVLSAPVSDRSVKKNIQSLNYGTDELMRLRPVSFEYKDGWKNYGQGTQIGFIAQDIQKILPNSVFTTPSTGKLGYNEIDLIPLLTSALQQSIERIEKLEKEVKKLKHK